MPASPLGSTSIASTIAGATALHEAAIRGYAAVVESLLRAGADHRVKDPHHHSTAMGWAQFGADFVKNAEGRYEDTVRALLAAGAEVRRDEHVSAHLRDQGLGTRDEGLVVSD